MLITYNTLFLSNDELCCISQLQYQTSFLMVKYSECRHYDPKHCVSFLLLQVLRTLLLNFSTWRPAAQ